MNEAFYFTSRSWEEYAWDVPRLYHKDDAPFVRRRSQLYAVYNAIPPPIVHAGS